MEFFFQNLSWSRIDDHLRKVYSEHSKAENWRMVRYPDIGHVEIPEMRAEVLSFLSEHL